MLFLLRLGGFTVCLDLFVIYISGIISSYNELIICFRCDIFGKWTYEWKSYKRELIYDGVKVVGKRGGNKFAYTYTHYKFKEMEFESNFALINPFLMLSQKWTHSSEQMCGNPFLYAISDVKKMKSKEIFDLWNFESSLVRRNSALWKKCLIKIFSVIQCNKIIFWRKTHILETYFCLQNWEKESRSRFLWDFRIFVEFL